MSARQTRRCLPDVAGDLHRGLLLLGLAVLAAAGCRARGPITEPLTLAGGKTVPVEVLNEGYERYTLYCFACHGDKGDGRGPAAPGMRPPPRDLTQGMFKFAGVAAGGLPHDDDLSALIRHGLAGTPMLPWDITERERHAIVQYIKTFSPRWKSEEPGEKVRPDGADPWRGREAEAIEVGRRLYHVPAGLEVDPQTKEPRAGGGLAGVACNGCHPSYISRAEIDALAQRHLGKAAEFREEMFRPERKESEYMVGDRKVAIVPTDFLFHAVKNGTSPEALFRTIAAGIGGTAMPQWKGSIPDESLWALAHYVKSLADKRGTPEAVALQNRLVSAGR